MRRGVGVAKAKAAPERPQRTQEHIIASQSHNYIEKFFIDKGHTVDRPWRRLRLGCASAHRRAHPRGVASRGRCVRADCRVRCRGRGRLGRRAGRTRMHAGAEQLPGLAAVRGVREGTRRSSVHLARDPGTGGRDSGRRRIEDLLERPCRRTSASDGRENTCRRCVRDGTASHSRRRRRRLRRRCSIERIPPLQAVPLDQGLSGQWQHGRCRGHVKPPQRELRGQGWMGMLADGSPETSAVVHRHAAHALLHVV